MCACIYKMYIRMYHIVSIYIPIISSSICISTILSSISSPSIIIIAIFFVIVRIVDEPPPWSARAWHFTVTFKGTSYNYYHHHHLQSSSLFSITVIIITIIIRQAMDDGWYSIEQWSVVSQYHQEDYSSTHPTHQIIV